MRWNVNSGSYTIGDLVRLYKSKRLIINRSYQRGFVWSARFQRDLIVSLLKGNPINSLTLRVSVDDEDVLEVVDGQQRLITIINFVEPDKETNRLFFNSTHSKIAQNLLNSDNKINSFKNIDEFTRINFKSQISIPYQTIKGSDEEIKAYFSMIQQQEEVKAGEIISNMPFEIYEDLRKYFDESENFLKLIGFNNYRGNFLKILIANFGIKHNLFYLGAKDDEVIKFAKDLNNSFKNNLSFKGICKESFKEDIKHSFIFLNRIEKSIDIGKGKLRFLRLFLLISNLIKQNSVIKIDFLALINKKLSSINDKETLINADKRQSFIDDLIDSQIINDRDEFDFFIKLSNLFSKTKRISSDHLKVINFWKDKVTKTI